MSTYTDLHNKIKENLTVGYNPDDRITTQKVRFYNEGNEYWGTFKGSFRAEQVDLDGGELRNVKITNAVLSNISWPGGVDFDAFGALLTNVSAEVDSINDVKLPSAHQRITEEISARVAQDGALKSMILNTDVRLSAFSEKIANDMRREMSALKFDLTYQTKGVSADLFNRSHNLSTELSNSIDDLSISFNDSLYSISTDLSTQDRILCAELHDKVDKNYSEMLANDHYLSSELSLIQLNLVDEIGNRARADKALKNDIDSVSAISDIRDGILQDHIDQLNADASLSIDVLRDETTYNIEIERHYDYKVKANGFTNIKSYPFQLNDYAVNSFKFRDIDGQVYLGTDTGVYVALVKKDQQDSLFPLTLYPYKNNKADYLFNSAFDASKPSYKFDSPDQSIYIGNGFYMTLVAPAQEEQKSELSNYHFTIEPQAENCHNICTLDGEMDIGNVTAAYPSGNQANIISGLLTINSTSDPTYKQFSHFTRIPFNTTDLSASEPDNMSVGYVYHGGNQLDLVHYHPLRYFTRLSDDIVDHNNETFGILYQKVAGTDSVVRDELGNITQIKVFLKDYSPGQPIILKNTNNFEEVLDNDYHTDDGRIAIISLKAQVNNNQTAIFSIGQKSTLYSYNFYGKDAEGDDVIPVGKIIPRKFNSQIDWSDTDFNELTADVSHVIMFQSMNAKIAELGGLVLKKSEIEGENDIWYTSIVDGENNVLDAKYIGHSRELCLKITLKNSEDSEIGQIIAQKYIVDLSIATSVDGGDESTFTLHKTKELDLSVFDETERKTDTYPVLINQNVLDNSESTWNLTITTAENTIFKAVVPSTIIDENGKIVLREFVIDAEIESTLANDTTFRKFKLFDDHGCPLTLVNTTQSDATSIYVNPNRRAIYAIKEVAPNQFAILDFNDEEDNHWIELLTQKTNNLSVEIQLLSATLSNDISTLSSNLFADIKTLSTQLSIDIKTLSTQLSTDISTLSTNLCIDINQLSNNISADVFTLSSNLCADIMTLSTNLCIDIKELSVELSTDISCLSSSLCNVISLSVENLQKQIISNDTDIEFLISTLNTLSTNISTDVSCLSANVSSDISSLSAHYYKTLSTDIKLDVVYHHDGSQDTLTRPVYTDQLLIIDEITLDRYCLTIRNGALNIKKVDNQAIFD